MRALLQRVTEASVTVDGAVAALRARGVTVKTGVFGPAGPVVTPAEARA